MTRAAQEIVFDVTGQELVFDAPSRPASVTSVDVLPWDSGDDDTAESATTGTASIDSVNTTFDAASGVSQDNPRICNLTATTGIVLRRQYLATNALGETEWVEVGGITSATSVISNVNLMNDYASTDTFVGTRISIDVDSTWIADENNVINTASPNPSYRVRWVWVDADSKTHVDYTFVRLVRVEGRHGVTAIDMEAVLPNWISMLPQGHREDGGARLLAEAHRRVKVDLHAAGIADEQVRNQEIVDEAVKRAAVVVLLRAKLRSGAGEVDISLTDAIEDYNSLINRLFTIETRVPVATTSDSAAVNVSSIGIWSR